MISEIQIKNQLSDIVGNIEKNLSKNKYKEIALELKEKNKEIMDRDKIHIVVVGEYSTGKSSFISALTGRNDIEIDSDVMTTETTLYDHNGLCIIDTPGLFSGNDEHTRKAIRAILEADRIVYMLSNNMFTPDSKRVFVDLIKKRECNNKIVLVINKMDSGSAYRHMAEVAADVYEQIEDELDDEGIDPEKVSMQCVSVKRYLDGQKYSDDGMIKNSYFQELESLISKIGGSQYAIRDKFQRQIDLIKNYLEQIEDCRLKDFTDEEKRNIEENKREIRIRIEKTRRDCKDIIRNDMSDCENDMMKKWKDAVDEGNEPLEDVWNGDIQEIFNRKVSTLKEDIQRKYDDLKYDMIQLAEEKKIENFQVVFQQYDQNIEEKKLKKSKRSNKNIGKETGKGLRRVAKIIKKKAGPVEIVEKTWYGRKIKRTSKIGGEGTELYKILNKVPIIKNNAENVSTKLAKGAEFIEKNGNKISVFFTFVDVFGDIAEFAKDRHADNSKKIYLRKANEKICRMVKVNEEHILQRVDDSANELLNAVDNTLCMEKDDVVGKLLSDTRLKLEKIQNQVNEIN